MKKLKQIVLLSFMSVFLVACDLVEEIIDEVLEFDSPTEETIDIAVDDEYNTAQEVIDYLELYEELPPNYLTKKEAKELGWDASEGNLWDVAPDASIGGDYFGNFEGLLPDEDGRKYYEADIEYEGGYRNAKRLIYSNDKLYFYTDNHYESFDEMKPSGDIK